MKRLLVLAATLLSFLSAPALAVATNAPAADPRQRGGSGDQFYRVFLGQNDANGDGVITKSDFRGSAAHFDAGYKLNQWAWVTDGWEISLVPQVKNRP
jgi:hypothetical protein